jgi:hypothetical protein
MHSGYNKTKKHSIRHSREGGKGSVGRLAIALYVSLTPNGLRLTLYFMHSHLHGFPTTTFGNDVVVSF